MGPNVSHLYRGVNRSLGCGSGFRGAASSGQVLVRETGVSPNLETAILLIRLHQGRLVLWYCPGKPVKAQDLEVRERGGVLLGRGSMPSSTSESCPTGVQEGQVAPRHRAPEKLEVRAGRLCNCQLSISVACCMGGTVRDRTGEKVLRFLAYE